MVRLNIFTFFLVLSLKSSYFIHLVVFDRSISIYLVCWNIRSKIEMTFQWKNISNLVHLLKKMRLSLLYQMFRKKATLMVSKFFHNEKRFNYLLLSKPTFICSPFVNLLSIFFLEDRYILVLMFRFIN